MTAIFRSATPSRGSDRLSALPLHWDGSDRSLDALSGQVGTLVRATVGGAMVGADGRVAFARHSQARWDMVLDAATGRKRPGLLLEPARTNLVVRSEDFSTGWTDIATPTLAAAAHAAGDLVLSTVGDDDGAALEGKAQVVAFTGDGLKAVSLFLKRGTSTSVVLRLEDTTAATNRLGATITWAVDTPSIVMSTGTLIGQRELANGIWELRFQTTTVTAANTNRVVLYPATTAALATANTGTVHAGGVAAFDARYPGQYLRTAAAAVTANAEQLSWPFLLPRRRVWMYLAFTELGSYHLAGAGAGYCVLGDITGTGLGLYPNDAGTGYASFHYVGGSGAAVGVASSFGSFGQLIELLVTMDVTGQPTLTVARNGVTVGSAAAGTPSDMTTAYTGAIARLGAFGSATSHVVGGAAYHALKVGEHGLGTPTLAKARGYR